MMPVLRSFVPCAAGLLLLNSGGLAQTDHVKDAPIDFSKEKTLYVIGYAHLDTEWRWPYTKVIREFIPNTMRDNLALMRDFPSYVFNFTGSRRYEMMKEYYPAEYEQVKAAIAAGRWFPAGSSVDEGDSVVPSAESLIRHVLYGNHFFEREFGKSSEEFMLPDCFGFPWALPSILAHCGIKGFSTQKLTWGSAVGIPFKVGRWIGPDGSEVVAALDPGAYTGKVEENLAKSETWRDRIAENGGKSGVLVDYHYYGTGDKGGAPGRESVEWIEKSVNTKGPVRVVAAEADDMVKRLTPGQVAKLPEYDGEFLLTEHSAGSITSQAAMKRWNKKNEMLADAAERASVGAMWLGGAPYPSKVFYDAWNLILGSQMHDILPGTSLPKAYEYAWNDEIVAANLLAETEANAVAGVAAAMDTAAQGVPLVVYNSLSIDREDPVEATVEFPAGAPAAVRVFGPDGAEAPSQVLDRSDKSIRVLFLAKVPSVGFATFDVRPADAPYDGKSSLRVTDREIENGRYLVKISDAGDIVSIYDKAAKRELLSQPAQIEFHYENPEKYPAWNMDWADRQKPPIGVVDGPAKVRVVENGPVRVALEIGRESSGSKFTQQIRLTDGDSGNRVELPIDIDWMTRSVSLKQAFPLAVSNPIASYDSQLGIVKRGNNDPKKYEVPQHQWLDLTDKSGDYGVGILTEAKYGSDKPSDDTLRLTLLYTPAVRGSFQDQQSQDIGRHHILYGVAGHEGAVEKSDVAWQASRMIEPLMPFVATSHPGELGRSFSLFKTSTAQVAISAIKKAEDSDAVVVRLRELAGAPAKGRLTAAAAIERAAELNGQERLLAKLKPVDGALDFDVPAFGLRTYAVQLAAPAKKVEPAVSTPVALPFDADVMSTDANRADGSFDANGRTYPAEMIPAKFEREGVTFAMGSAADGAKNAVTCRGQTIALPAGAGNRLVVLASARKRTEAAFKVGADSQPVVVGDWGGYVGQWDNRLWGGDVPEEAYEWYNPMIGLVPGFIHREPIAWFASHRHHPQNGNEFYQYSYIFKYTFDVPRDTTSVVLPDDPNVSVFAMSLVKGGPPPVAPAAPLYDTLANHESGGREPQIVAPAGVADDVISVTILPPLYYDGPIRYTTDGTDPTESSPAVEGPIRLASTKTVKARAFLSSGPGPVAEAKVRVNDATAPGVVSALAIAGIPQLRIDFSEEVDAASAGNVANYAVPGRKVVSAKPDERGVTLTLDRPLTQPVKIGVLGVADRSPAANAVKPQGVDVPLSVPVYAQPAGVQKTEKTVDAANLPVKAGEPWTLNLFVLANAEPENRTLIAGFGAAKDKTGQARYFSKFANGIHFWIADNDFDSTTPLDVGKWQMLTATFDGKTMRLYKNGEEIASGKVTLSDDEAKVRFLPIDPWDDERRLDGEVSGLKVWDAALPASAVKQLWEAREVGR